MFAGPLRTRTRRRGSTIVESALVLSVFLMLLFGVFEYCRFLLILHVTNNAARDGARFASVNVNCPPDEVAGKKDDIITATNLAMGGTQKNIIGFQVAVYPCDQSGFAQNPPKVIPKSLSTTTPADPFNASDPNNPAWNQAAFTERIAVTIRGTYKPITPLLLFMPAEIPIDVTAVMGSEG